MTSTLSPTENSEDLWVTEPAMAPKTRPAGLKGEQPSRGNQVARGLRRFLIIFCMGVGTTLAWQSYGDQVRGMIAKSSPQLDWLGPQAAAVAEASPELVPTSPPANSPDREEFKAMSLDLAALRQGMDEHLAALRRIDELAAQFAASQQEMASDIAKLKAAEQDLLANISSAPPPPRPAAAPARKPTSAPPQFRQQPPGR